MRKDVGSETVGNDEGAVGAVDDGLVSPGLLRCCWEGVEGGDDGLVSLP